MPGGLNACKGQDIKGKNSCTGEGICATAVAHSCQYTNSCEFQGGCGYPGRSESGAADYNPSQNSCQSNGGCQSPISPKQYYRGRMRNVYAILLVFQELL